MGRVRVHWRSYTRDPLVASFRYRCLVPAMGLDRAGLAVNRFSVTGQDACLESETDVLVLVKTLTRVDLDLARRAKELGRKVVLDLCDNAFFWPGFYTERLDTKHHFHYSLQAHLLRELATVVDAIVVPTTALEKRLREEFPALRILVIPDPMESESIRSSLRGRRWLLALNSYFATPYVALKYGIWAGVPFFAQGLSRRFGEKLWKLVSPAFSALSRGFEALANYFRSTVSRTWPGIDEKKLRQAEALPPAKHPSFRWPAPKDVEGKRRLVWFGNCGIPGAFGITELKLIEPELSRLYQKHPFVLTVVSDYDGFLSHYFKDCAFPIRFVQWTMAGCVDEIRASDVVIIPNSDNDFARHKSPNRAVLSFSLGKPVVASRIESLEPFRDCLVFDDFEGGIARYLESPALREEHIRRADEISRREFAPERVVQMWGELLNSLVPESARSVERLGTPAPVPT